MRPALIFTLSSVLFKSYFRASRSGRVSLTFSRPRIMLLIDLIALLIPLVFLQYILTRLPEELIIYVKPLIWQILVGLPIILTSAIIVAGILFELSQSSGLSSSEAVNWLPITSREYVSASALSVITVYSPLFALSLGVTLPLSLEFGLLPVWVIVMVLSFLALLLGAFIVEILRAVVNRVSSTVYKKSGKFGVVSRLILLVILFVVIQLAFNPIILYSVLGVVVRGVEVVWFIPMIWPSVAAFNLVRSDVRLASVFLVLSVAFTALVFWAASDLRQKYWSPTPVSITITSSTEYIPQKTALPILGFSSVEAAIALKEFRVLVRRKDMARFISIPIILVIAFVLPTLFTPSDYSGKSPGFFLAAFIPFMIPLLLSMITIGQEGKAVINLYMLPISVKELIKGKLLPNWTISILATLASIGVFHFLAPMGTLITLLTILAGLFVIVVESFLGLGVGSRYPDYTIGPRSRYVTFTGFLVGFILGALMAVIIYSPAALYLISSQGWVPIPSFSFIIPFVATIAIGVILSHVAYHYCKKGVRNLLLNLA